MRKKFFYFMLLVVIPSTYAQNEYATSNIDPGLLQNADAVIRNLHQKTIIEDLDRVVTYTTRVITVLNEQGENYLNAYEYYSEGDEIKDQEALILDSAGDEIIKIKQKDFNDVSAYGSSTLFSDSRVRFLDYTARSYPYTVKYTSRFESENSVFLNGFYPIEGYGISTEKAVFELVNPNNYPIRHKEINFDGYGISNDNNEGIYTYSVNDIPARILEPLSPSFDKTVPQVLFSLDVFELESIKGKSGDWKRFGKWMYDHLVADHDQLPPKTVARIDSLTRNANTLEDKARIIYQYVQDNTRYISVQYGIGGWEPENASVVDKLGYGDCKALTNYTKALLKSQGIESYYTVVYSGSKRDISPDFAIMQGDHVILNVPREDSEDIWLECTNQNIPFDYLGDFTDDRYVLKISSEGGEIVKTKKYTAEENLQQINCTLQLNDTGGFEASFLRVSEGIPYGDKYHLTNKQTKELKEYYRDSWSGIQNLRFDSIEFDNNRELIRFSEKLKFRGEHLATTAGERLLIPLNFIQQQSLHISSSEERKMPLEVSRGKTYKDLFVFMLPEDYEIEAVPKSDSITSDFGKFSIDIKVNKDTNAIEVERLLIVEEGKWERDRFQEFQLFLGMVSRLNNLKAVIVKS